MTSSYAECPAAVALIRSMLRGAREGLRKAACAPAVAAAFVAVAPAAQAALVGDYTVRTIVEVFTFSDFGGGDVVLKVTPQIAGCEGGFWLRPVDPGFKINAAAVFMAFQGKTGVRIWAYNDQLWTGSGSPTCRLNTISLV